MEFFLLLAMLLNAAILFGIWRTMETIADAIWTIEEHTSTKKDENNA